VVSSPFYEQMVDVVRGIADRKGAFTLVLLLPSSAHDSAEWNAVFSASWLDSLNLRLAVKTMLDSLKSSLPELGFSKIQRVSILRTTEPFVREVTADLNIQLGTVYRVQSFAFSRFGVDEALVFVAERPSQGNMPPQTSTVRA
jgi:hypothetical protein